ncbi:hypothetical protein EV356DRAFT_323771 [Viridothelium virens]|uniref:Uncharacterized protein n=1 Tax=Viridothelium virens TaxID=1048519 RepID=A0A6A6GYD9_VIRVR|nr:hypothetical protein EV356DRAFT_323771 [Viridothelium virens]
MSVVFLDRWDLLQKCSQFIADFLFKTFSSDDDQWLIHNTILEIEALRIPPKPKPWENPFIVSWYVENSLRSLDGLIDDKILEGCRVADGNFRKLQAVVQLLENRSKPDHFVKQSAGSLEETKRTFVELNKCIKGQIASKLEEDLRRSIGTNSDHLFKTLVQNSTCCDKTGLHHVAKLQLVSSETLHPANNNGEPVYSYIVFLGTTSKQGPEPWHQLTFHFNS